VQPVGLKGTRDRGREPTAGEVTDRGQAMANATPPSGGGDSGRGALELSEHGPAVVPEPMHVPLRQLPDLRLRAIISPGATTVAPAAHRADAGVGGGGSTGHGAAEVVDAAHAAGRGARRGASDAAEDRAALDRLVVRQREHLGSAMDELLCYDAKVGHWAWWAFPTPIPGQSEPQPPCYITPAMAPALLDRAPPCWKSLLECLAHLLQRRRLDDVLPARDLARFADFLAFWSEIACPQWLHQVLRTFDSYLCGHKARQLRRHTTALPPRG